MPRISARPEYAIGVLAVFGSLLTPDVIVWQTSSRKDTNQVHTSHTQESRAGTLVAAAISLSAIISASTLRVAVSGDLTTRMAAEALSPLGTLAPLVFALGIIGPAPLRKLWGKSDHWPDLGNELIAPVSDFTSRDTVAGVSSI